MSADLDPTLDATPEQADTSRADWIAGWRALLDWLEQHPEVALPTDERILHYCMTREELATVARALGRATKRADDDYFFVVRAFGPVRYEAYTSREQVCRPVIVGTETVAEQVTPAHERPIIEWHCDDPLLAALPDRGEQP